MLKVENTGKEKMVWIVNTGDLVSHVNIQLKKHIELKTNIPLQFPLQIALEYTKKYKNVQLCNNPQNYFTEEKKLKRLVIRDAGIGDLILLEPVLRKMCEDKKMQVDVACMFPEVYDNHPLLNKVIQIDTKENLERINYKNYDCWEDLRNYSETSPLRNREHRTDIYNELFHMQLSDEEKEPRLYFKKDEISSLKKKDKYIYIGIQCDASHKYRQYEKGAELIEYLLNQNDKFIIVLMGHWEYVKIKPNKRIINLQGKTSRREAILIIRDLDYLIAADSGLLHVALTLHVPTVALFSIITPDFRIKYYTGHKKIIWKELECRGCGDWHMIKCSHLGKGIEGLAPCMDIKPSEIYTKLVEMPINNEKRIFINEIPIEKEKIENVNVNFIPTKKITLPIIVQNEEKNLPRFIELVMCNKNIGRVIAIDGGSNDKTVKLLKKAGAEVYIHPYIKTYHEQQAMQRNISCSYVADGENILIMDIDECFSKELENYLPELCETDIVYALISRRTFEYYNDSFDISKSIKDYPDWQPRFYKWDRRYKFVGGAHHITLNTPNPLKIQKDIIHFEKEGKDREQLEKQWAFMMNGVKKYT